MISLRAETSNQINYNSGLTHSIIENANPKHDGRNRISDSCGVTEIRTRDTLLTYTRFPGVPLQPLEHHSSLLRVQR